MSLLITLTKKIAKVLAYLLCILIVMIVLPPIVMLILGYKVNVHSDELARKLVDSKKGPQACMKIVNYGILGPSSGESQAHCVKRYAEYAKDPSACELLMPSSYGWSCLGAAEEPNARICWFDFTKELYNSNKPVMPECGGKNDSFSRRCCEMATMLYVEKKSDCSIFNEPPELQDQCLELVARRERNAKTCDEIKNLHVKSACQVAVQALQKK